MGRGRCSMETGAASGGVGSVGAATGADLVASGSED